MTGLQEQCGWQQKQQSSNFESSFLYLQNDLLNQGQNTNQ